MKDWKDAVIVVTGGAAGLGRASALRFARLGGQVIVVDVRAEAAEEVADQIKQIGGRSIAVGADLAHREQVEEMVRRALDWQSRVDLFFSNAGIALTGLPEMIPLEDWERVFAVNYWASVWATQKLLPHMLERGSGHLLYTASCTGLVARWPQLPAYASSKFALIGFVESLACYCWGTGVGVSVLCPNGMAAGFDGKGMVEHICHMTSSQAEELGDRLERLSSKAGMGVLIKQPEEVAESIVKGVGNDDLFIFSHPEVLEWVQRKWSDPNAWIRGELAHLRRDSAACGSQLDRMIKQK